MRMTCQMQWQPAGVLCQLQLRRLPLREPQSPARPVRQAGEDWPWSSGAEATLRAAPNCKIWTWSPLPCGPSSPNYSVSLANPRVTHACTPARPLHPARRGALLLDGVSPSLRPARLGKVARLPRRVGCPDFILKLRITFHPPLAPALGLGILAGASASGPAGFPQYCM